MADMDALVQEIISKLQTQQAASLAPKPNASATVADYPVLEKHPEWVKTPDGRSVSTIDLAAVERGEIENKDIRISREMLLTQAQIAESAGKPQVAENFRRAAEMTEIPDELVIQMYDKLRPNRATYQELCDIAAMFEEKYNAKRCATLVREAAEIYRKRGILLG